MAYPEKPPSQVFAMKITISMPTSKVKLQGLLWHLNRLYLIATTGKERMTFKMSKRYIGGHQLRRFCNSFLLILWKPERWLLPPSTPAWTLLYIIDECLVQSASLLHRAVYILKDFFLISHFGLRNASILKCLNSPGKETVSGNEAVWSLHFLCCNCIISPRPKARLLFC